MANKNNIIIGMALIVALFSVSLAFAYTPEGPDTLTKGTSEIKSAVTQKMINVSGGTITPVNLSATIQNKRWKAFVGLVTGSYTLDDSSGATIYNWSLSTITGRVYATRNSSSIDWSAIGCSSAPQLENENIYMLHNNTDSVNDNITKTFEDTTHSQFYVGAVDIAADSCRTLNTFDNGGVQDTLFEEVALQTETNVVYATMIDQGATGYNGTVYDFQMIVPEVGSPGYTSSTPYYLYVEIGN